MMRKLEYFGGGISEAMAAKLLEVLPAFLTKGISGSVLLGAHIGHIA